MDASAPEVMDAGFALLDRQILDCDGVSVGKVDDLALELDPAGRLHVLAILCGPGAWGPRLGGRLGEWVVAVWRRLHPAAHPEPVRIPTAAIARIESAVHLVVSQEVVTTETVGDWIEEHFIGRIRGAGYDA